MHRFSHLALALGMIAASAALPRAETYVLDEQTGAVHDSIGDGWFFAGTAPPLPAPDGTGDAGGQALAIGLIAGVLELRAVSEFPLAPLTASGLTAAQIQSATLTFTIDDVIGTFGPGATFNNEASDPIAVYHFPGNGIVTTADFSPPGATQVGIVTPGLLTDATLASSGAVSFDVDVTAALRAALTVGNTAFGVLIGTTDSPTAASLDDLGVAGAALPIVTVVTIPLSPPVLSSAAQTCQATIAKASQKLIGTALQSFAGCFGLVSKDFAPDQTLAPTTAAKCASALDPNSPDSKLGKALGKLVADVEKKCEGLVPADLGSPCDPSATTIAQTATCLRDTQRALAESQIARQYASSCTLLSAVALDAAFPGICTP